MFARDTRDAIHANIVMQWRGAEFKMERNIPERIDMARPKGGDLVSPVFEYALRTKNIECFCGVLAKKEGMLTLGNVSSTNKLRRHFTVSRQEADPHETYRSKTSKPLGSLESAIDD